MNGKKDEIKKKAIKKFGITNNCKKAGFILEEGKLLDFTDPYDPSGYRMDHTMIGQINDDEIKSVDDFIEKTNSIRTYIHKDSMMLDLPSKVTKEQKNKIEDCICNHNPKSIIVERYEQKEYGFPMAKRFNEEFDSSGDCIEDSKETQRRIEKIKKKQFQKNNRKN